MGKGLWEEYDANMLRHALGGIPQNAYEEQIELTKQGKLWQFPIDNEAGTSKTEMSGLVSN